MLSIVVLRGVWGKGPGQAIGDCDDASCIWMDGHWMPREREWEWEWEPG